MLPPPQALIELTNEELEEGDPVFGLLALVQKVLALTSSLDDIGKRILAVHKRILIVRERALRAL